MLRAHPRPLALLAVAALAAAYVVAVPLSSPSYATLLPVSNEAEYIQALADLSEETAGPHIIEIDADFEITGSDPADYVYDGDQDLTIRGFLDGTEITHNQATPVPFLDFAPTASAGLTIDGLTLTNFAGDGVILAGDEDTSGVTLDGVTIHASISAIDGLGEIAQGGAVSVRGDVTVIDSTFTANAVAGDGSQYAAVIQSWDGDVTVTNSLFSGGHTALSVDGGTIDVSDSQFLGNGPDVAGVTSDNVGGAIFLFETDGTITDSVFQDNSGTFAGAGVLAADSHVTITGTDFDGNTLDPGADCDLFFAVVCGGGAAAVINAEMLSLFAGEFGGGGEGGGEDLEEPILEDLVANASLEVTDSTFTSNTADGELCDSELGESGLGCLGGAIHAFGGGVTVSDSTFGEGLGTGNTSGSIGGAISSFWGQVTVADSEFIGNTASTGGALALAYSMFDVAGSLFLGNSAEGVVEGITGGGGIFAITSDDDLFGLGGSERSSVVNSTFLANAAGEGGGILAIGEIDLTHLTMTDNLGGALYADSFSGGEPEATLSSSVIVSGEGEELDGGPSQDGPLLSGSNCGASEGAYGIVSLGYNYIDDDSCIEPLSTDTVEASEDPLLGGVTVNEGFSDVPSMLPGAGSPLIDAIPTADCVIDVDARGIGRPHDGDGDGTLGCDIGAAEVIGDFMQFTVDTPGGPVTGTIPGIWRLDDVDTYAPLDLPGTVPADTAFPFHAFGFTAVLAEGQDTIEIELELPTPVASLWKNSGSSWFELDGVTIDGTTVTYSLTDGDTGDTDGTVNGEIVDPVAPGIGAAFTG